jgi:hypothetical protein
MTGHGRLKTMSNKAASAGITNQWNARERVAGEMVEQLKKRKAGRV